MFSTFNLILMGVLMILLMALPFAVRRVKRFLGRRRLKPFERSLFQELAMRRLENFKGIFEENKANPNLRDFNGSPIIYAAASHERNLEFLDYLLSKGADVNARDVRGRTPLFYTSYVGEIKPLMKLLSCKGIDLNASNDSLGFEVNPLTAALYRNRVEVFRVLLNAGADPVIAEKLIQKSAKQFTEYKDGSVYKRMLEASLRWHRGQKQMVFVKEMSEKKKSSSQPSEPKTNINLAKLNPVAFKTILVEYL